MSASLNQDDIKLLSSVFATKKNLAQFATKKDLAQFATKKDLAQFATKKDLAQFATKKDLAQFATKNDINKKFEELEKIISKSFIQVESRIQNLESIIGIMPTN